MSYSTGNHDPQGEQGEQGEYDGDISAEDMMAQAEADLANATTRGEWAWQVAWLGLKRLITHWSVDGKPDYPDFDDECTYWDIADQMQGAIVDHLDSLPDPIAVLLPEYQP